MQKSFQHARQRPKHVTDKKELRGNRTNVGFRKENEKPKETNKQAIINILRGMRRQYIHEIGCLKRNHQTARKGSQKLNI